MPNLLLEIGTEELPARFLLPARTHLSTTVQTLLDDLRLDHGAVTVEATPRRLVVMVDDVASTQRDREEEVMGPRADIAWDKDGALTKAGLGFLTGKGLTEKDAAKKETKKGVVIAAVVKERGLAATDVLPERLNALVANVSFAKTMRWTDSKESFGRPVRWLLALHGDMVLPLTFNGVSSSNTTRGHRFHSPDPKVVDGVSSYRKALVDGEVMLSVDERKSVILERARALAKDAGGRLREDDALLDTVSNLVEKPWPIVGKFDARFLEIPKEILISEMREHQKYFAVEDDDGNLLPAFIIVAGSKPPDADFVAAGHTRVLRSRFEDGAFYFREDLATKLDDRAEKLARILFQRDLGTLADKTAHISTLSGWIADHASVSDDVKTTALRAAALCKADLASGVVGEFPELQGTMGRHYAVRQGETTDVARAIEAHYEPRHAGAAMPDSVAGAIVGIADRTDTLTGILGVSKVPTGSADPFGLRRAAIAIANLAMGKGLAFSLSGLVDAAIAAHGDSIKKDKAELRAVALEFFATRLRSVLVERLAEKGMTSSQDIADAAIQSGFDNLVDLGERADALATLRQSDATSFQALAATFKRVGNILNKARSENLTVDPNTSTTALTEASETALLASVSKVETLKETTGAAGYAALLGALVELKPAVDAFFDGVMVMADDVKIRDARIGLLARIERILVRLADFTKIQVD